MAKPSRQQRRDRRAQQPALAGAGAPPTAPPTPTARGGDEPERRRPREAEQQQSGPRRPVFIRFVGESYAELKKVEWPDQKAVISGTVVVLVACVIVGAFLWLNDEVWKYVVKHVLL